MVRTVCRQQEGSKDSVEVNPMTVFQAAVLNAKPLIGTTRMTRGGKHYHVRSPITLISDMRMVTSGGCLALFIVVSS